jgi:hypothetical protein
MAGLHNQKTRPALARIYLALLQCLYQDPAADTSCILPSQGVALSGISFEMYLDELVAKQMVASEVRDTACRLWERLNAAYPGRISEPDAAPGVDYSLLFAFDDGLNHLEFEILKKDFVEVYFLRRDTDEMWEDEVVGETSLSKKLLKAVELFLK